MQDTCKSQSIKKDAKLKLEKQEKRVVNYDAMISKATRLKIILKSQALGFTRFMGVADPEVEQKPPKIFLPQKLKKNLILGRRRRRDMNATVNCSFSKGLDEEKGP